VSSKIIVYCIGLNKSGNNKGRNKKWNLQQMKVVIVIIVLHFNNMVNWSGRVNNG